MDTSKDLIDSGIVLIVEDDDSLRQAIALALKVRGFDYLEFDNARDVSVVLGKGSIAKPTCMLLDIRLGSGPSGLTVFDEIGGLGLTERVPVIFMTGHGDLETAVEVMRTGAFDFVTKPFSTPDLIKKLSRPCWTARPQTSARPRSQRSGRSPTSSPRKSARSCG